MDDGVFIPVVTRARVAEGEGPPKLALARRTLYFDTLNGDLYVGTKNGPAVVGGPALVIGQGVLKRRVDNLTVDLATAETTLRAEFEEAIEVAVTATEAVATRTTTLEGQVQTPTTGLLARMTTEETVRASADGVLAGRATTLEGQVQTPTTGLLARMTTEETVRASADGVLAGRATTLEGQVQTPTTGLLARMTTEETVRASADGVLAGRATTLEAQVGNTVASGLSARIGTEESTRASADTALALRATTLEARSGGSNLLKRSQFTSVVSGYGVASDFAPWTIQGDMVLATSGIYAADASWSPPGEYSLFSQSLPNGTYSDMTSEPVPVEAGKRYCASAYTGVFNSAEAGSVRVFIEFRDAAGTATGYSEFNGASYHFNTDGLPGGPSLNQFKRIRDFGTAPAGTVDARVYIRRARLGPNCYVWMTRAMLSEATATQTTAPPFAPSASEARMKVTEFVAIDAQGKANALFGVTQDVNGYVSGFSSVNNGANATFQILADRFGIRDPGGTNAVEYVGGTWRITDAASATRTRYGKPFGGAAKLVWWTGASSVAIDSETKANADVYISMVAPRFGGGAVPSPFSVAQSHTGRSGTRFGAGSVTTNTVTLTPTGNVGAVTYTWANVFGDSSLSATAATSAATAFSGSVASLQQKQAQFAWTATDSGTGQVRTGYCAATILDAT